MVYIPQYELPLGVGEVVFVEVDVGVFVGDGAEKRVRQMRRAGKGALAKKLTDVTIDRIKCMPVWSEELSEPQPLDKGASWIDCG